MAVNEEAAAKNPPCAYRLIAGDELGHLRVVEAPQLPQLGSARATVRWGEPDRGNGVVALCCSSREGLADTETAVVAASRVGGAVQLLDCFSGAVQGSIPAAPCSRDDPADSNAQGVALLWSAAAASSDRRPLVLSCTRGGMARLHAPPPDQQPGPSCAWQEQASWQAPGNVYCMAVDEGSSRMALGCQGTELTLWDLNTQQRLYLAKGAKPNSIGLVDKPWNSAVTFLPGSQGQRLLTGTGEHKLRLYDTRARRPALQLEFGDARVTALAPEPSGLRCWAANGKGQMQVLDLAAGKLLGALKGATGSVRALAVHPHQPLVASVGLDSFLRLHHTATRQLLAKVYLKQCLTGVSFTPVPSQEVVEPAESKADAGREDGAEAPVPIKRAADGNKHHKKKSKRAKIV